MKLWQKNTDASAEVDRFTVGLDRKMDIKLAGADVLGSLAHTRMLEKIGLLTPAELEDVQRGLKEIYREIGAGNFTIEEGGGGRTLAGGVSADPAPGRGRKEDSQRAFA